MINVNYLIGNQDIVKVDVVKEDLKYILTISFEWNVDYGCFKQKKCSNLTIIVPEEKENEVINELKNNKGLIYEYINKHKEYTGKLIDLGGLVYED